MRTNLKLSEMQVPLHNGFGPVRDAGTVLTAVTTWLHICNLSLCQLGAVLQNQRDDHFHIRKPSDGGDHIIHDVSFSRKPKQRFLYENQEWWTYSRNDCEVIYWSDGHGQLCAKFDWEAGSWMVRYWGVKGESKDLLEWFFAIATPGTAQLVKAEERSSFISVIKDLITKEMERYDREIYATVLENLEDFQRKHLQALESSGT